MVRFEYSPRGGEGEQCAHPDGGGNGAGVQERGELLEGEEVWVVKCLFKKGMNGGKCKEHGGRGNMDRRVLD